MLNTTGFNHVAVSGNDGHNKARNKMESLIEQGRVSGAPVIEQVMNRAIKDSIVRGRQLSFQPNKEKPIIDMFMPDGGKTYVHKNAFDQLAERAGLHTGDMGNLIDKGEWGKELVADIFSKIYSHGNGTRYLIRQADGYTMGFLSDSFRRIDSRPLIEALAIGAGKVGAVPVQGWAGDTKVMLRIILPLLFEPVPNEFHLFGCDWRNSDFGNGGHELRFFDMRVACTNGATFEQILRQVHIGARLNDNLEYSQRTYELDSKADAAKLQDVLALNVFTPNNVNRLLSGVVSAHEKKLGDDPKQLKAVLGKTVNKSEAEKIIDLYNGADVQNLPEGKTAYRLSNAISFFANGDKVAPERKLDLQQLAGSFIKS